MSKRVYLFPIEPEKYPEYTRRAASAVTRAVLGNTIQFTSLRGFPTTSTNMKEIGEAADMGARPMPDEGSQLKEIEETIDLYVDYFKLGKVLWPVYPTLFAGNFRRLVDICAERGLYLYDFWGYVPGSKPCDGIWGEYSIPRDTDEYMRQKLGERFLGYDNGEQDGRYIHASGATALPTLWNRAAQYKNFRHYFEKLNDAMLNHTVTLASLTFLHYFAKEGNTIMIGAETAQALPSNPMWFSFIRGASKQYGLLNYGNASVWNRWGYKDYNVMSDEPDTSNGYEMGRTGGTSLSQLRRLIYNQYVYNCDILGFESSWFTTEDTVEGDKNDDKTYIVGKKKYKLTPVGEIQRYCGDFVRRNGNPGIMYAPLAVIIDFNSGWVPPRHLYSGDIYKVWGNLPYGSGDYQLHALFSMLYPGYENAGFYRDERGFLTPTPYGEICDVLLSDVRGEILRRYPAIFVCVKTKVDKEFLRKIITYVRHGGHAIVSAFSINDITDSVKFSDEFLDLFNSSGAYREIEIGAGKLTILCDGAGDGLESTEEELAYKNSVNEDIPQPYRFTAETKELLGGIFDELRIVYVTNRALQYTLDIKSADEYTLFVSNNTLNTERFDIAVNEGELVEVTEPEISDGVKTLPEFLPRHAVTELKKSESSGKYELSPYDCRIFNVKTRGIELKEVTERNPEPRDDKLFLSLGYNGGSASDFLMTHPTFAYRFGGLYIPAEYLDALDDYTAEREAHYFSLQNVKILVDFTRMLNHFPDLTIIGNFPKRTEESVRRIEKILRRAQKYGCEGAIFTLHRNAENEYTQEQAVNGAKKTLTQIAALSRELSIKPYFANRGVLIGFDEQIKFAESGEAGSLAFNIAFAMSSGSDPTLPECAELLLLSDIKTDMFGQKYAAQTPMNSSVGASERIDKLRAAYKAAKTKGIPIALVADYKDWDAVIDDLTVLR